MFGKTFIYGLFSLVPIFYLFAENQNRDEMRDRIQVKHEMCQKYNKKYNEDLFPSRFVFNEEKKVLGCLVNKVASTSFNVAFLQLLGMQIPQDLWSLTHLIRPGNSSILKTKLKDNDFYKFIFVREPLERLASCFYDKIVTNKADSLTKFRLKIKSMANKINRFNSTSNVTFTEFLQVILKTRPTALNFGRHWAPYYFLCSPCSIDYNFIGKLEKTEDFQRFYQETGVRIPLLHNELSQSKNMTQTLIQSVPKNVLKQVYKKYYLDYKLFGYEFPAL